MNIWSQAKLGIDDLVLIANDRVKGVNKMKSNNGPEYAMAIEFLEVAYE